MRPRASITPLAAAGIRPAVKRDFLPIRVQAIEPDGPQRDQIVAGIES